MVEFPSGSGPATQSIVSLALPRADAAEPVNPRAAAAETGPGPPPAVPRARTPRRPAALSRRERPAPKRAASRACSAETASAGVAPAGSAQSAATNRTPRRCPRPLRSTSQELSGTASRQALSPVSTAGSGAVTVPIRQRRRARSVPGSATQTSMARGELPAAAGRAIRAADPAPPVRAAAARTGRPGRIVRAGPVSRRPPAP